MQQTNLIKALLVEDVEMYREGLRLVLEKDGSIVVTGEAEDGNAALELLLKEQPDVVVTDIQMPVFDGIELTKEVRKYYPDIPVIALTVFEDDQLVVDMLEAGAKGYLLKNNTSQKITAAIKAVYAGGWYYCESTSLKLSKMIAGSKINHLPPPPAGTFTEHELEIIRLICQEYSSKEIAEKVFLGERTVESYRHKIFQKCGVKNMAGLVIYALRTGIYKP